MIIKANRKKLSKKKADRFRRARLKREQYYIEELSPLNRKKIKSLINLISDSFERRGLPHYEWVDNELLFKILNLFHDRNDLRFFVMHHPKQRDVGWFCLIENKNQLV